jgi:hypothetical protein
MSVEARLRVAAGDPGIRNYGFCVIELTHVDSIVGVEGPRTRTPVPRFRILHWEVMDLMNGAIAYASDGSSSSSSSAESSDESTQERKLPEPVRVTGLLGSLHAMLTSDKPDANNMPMWRHNLAVRMARACPVLLERYACTLTGREELPVIALENQLDVAVEKFSPEERAEWAKLQHATALAKAMSPDARHHDLEPWLADIVDLLARSRLELKRGSDFIKARMYTLSQVLAGAVESLDARNGDEDRLIINSAKKHAIASDGSRSYAQRKADAIALTFAMLKEQRDSATSTPEERAHAKKWLAFLADQKEDGQKLDDLCDAFLMAVAVALKVHKKYAKKVYKGPVMPCYAPVTNAELAAANKLPPKAAPKKRKRSEDAEDATKKPKKQKKKPDA